MALDPRTPVVVGVGQVVCRPDPAGDPAGRPEPAALMADALARAAEDAGGRAPGGGGPGWDLLARADSLRVVSPLSWHPVNPALAVSARLGIDPAEQVCTAIGGNMPIALLLDSARAIAAGRLQVALVTGAEAFHTKWRARAEQRELRWVAQGSAVPAAVPFGVDRPPASDLEVSRGIEAPLQAYPLLQNALAAAEGWSPAEQEARIGRLWSSFSEVAASNPAAWLPVAHRPEAIARPGPGNRMVAHPYTKLCMANMGVDQGAAFVCCSVGAARSAGVPEDRWVFPWAGAEADDHWFLSQRPALHRSPAMAAAGRRALHLAGVAAGELGPVDLYSCFPVVVEMAASALGLPVGDARRPLTVTGGLTFAGGPGNNYASHSVAAVVEHLRRDPGAAGLVSGLGWYATKHAFAVLGARPPARPYRWSDVQAEVDAQPRCPVDPALQGRVRVETHTVLFDRQGGPSTGIVACRDTAGTRTWANVTDPDGLDQLTSGAWVGHGGVVGAGGALALD